MSQLINVGLTANDGTGDKLRNAFIIVNENFANIDLILSNVLVSGSASISDINGLQSALDNIQSQLDYIPTIQNDITNINNAIFSINQTLNSQNISITDLYSQLSALQTQVNGCVPYTGATQDVDLGTHSISSEKGIYQFNDNNNQIALEKLEHYNRIYMDTTDTSSDEFGRFRLEANPELGLAVYHSKTGWNGSSFRLVRDGIEGYTFDETGSVVENRFNFTKDYFSVDKQIKSDTGLEVTNSSTGVFKVDNENPNYLSFGFLSNDISEDEFGSVLVNFNPEEAIVLRKDKPIFNSSGVISLTEGDISLSVDNLDYQQSIYIQSGDISLSVNDAQVNANNRLQILPESTYSKKLINTDVGFQITGGPEGEFFVIPTGAYLTYNFTSNGTLNGTPLVSMAANSEEGINLTNYDTLNNIISSLAILPNQTIIEINDGTNISQTRFLSTGTTFDKPISVPKVIMNSTTEVAGERELVWNDADGTLDLGLKGGNVTLQVGQENVIRVVNKTATNITLQESAYQAVRVTGAQGNRLKVDLAQATNDLLSAETIGLVTETILNNQEGFITTSGLVRNINTTGSLQGETWLDGDILYLSPTVAGRLTKIKPQAPNHLVIIGYVVRAHVTQGQIFVKVDNGYELDELHNVLISGATGGNVLTYNGSTDVWENKTVSQALGYTPLPTQAATTSGTTLTFVTDRIYGTLASPETGNITANVTGAQMGVTNIIIHNSGTAPTFSSEFKRLTGSSNYSTGQVNYIYCTYIASNEIIYSINQRT